MTRKFVLTYTIFIPQVVGAKSRYFLVATMEPTTDSKFHSGDQKIARFRSHLSEYRLGTQIWQTIYETF